MVVVFIVFRYRQRKSQKKKNSICDETIEAGVIPLSTKRQIITSSDLKSAKESGGSSDNSESSDGDVFYNRNSRYVIDRVQPKRQLSLQSQTSITSVESVDIETNKPSLVMSVVCDGRSASVWLVKGKHLRRSGHSPEDKLVAEGVFARLYPRQRTLSQTSDASQTENSDQTINSQSQEYFETSFIRSKKSSVIKFNKKEKFHILGDNFPVRISVYEMDKHRVRYNIGHCFLAVNTHDNCQSKQMIELTLESTIYAAKCAAISSTPSVN
ncbi:uncharacterized protein LOC128960101 [Oppia nitens]|uniref:uncharacterized protein LOC128960101 n=1 Tax=Oppia nitens TaxID=1686743 RepID=UPI0023DBF659|nr:uncharacterized protein LOC128960101 [Oppia nitens]